MAPNEYLYEKVLEMRRLDLQREMAQRRLLAQLPKQRRNRGRNAVYGLGALLVKLGLGLEQVDRLQDPARERA